MAGSSDKRPKGASGSLEISAVIFQEDGTFVAQCLQYDLVAQASTIPDLHYELERVLAGQLAVSEELGLEPFAGFPPAPQKFWDMYEHAHLRLEGERSPFRLPRSSPLLHIIPTLKFAEPQRQKSGVMEPA